VSSFYLSFDTCFLSLTYSNIGYLCAITWQTGVAGSAFFAGTLIQGIFVLNIATYDFQRWHGSLLTILFIFIALTFNTFLARKLPIVEGLFVIIHILGILIFIPLWIMAPKREGGSPLIEFFNEGGWATNGLATLVGSVGPASALTGFDCSVHMGILSLAFLPTFSYLIAI
jgi:amino acid transporter